MLRNNMTARRAIGVALCALGSWSCSSSDSSTLGAASTAPKANERLGDIRVNDTWKDGTHLTGLIRIVEGVTVTVEPGAKITCSDAVQIQIGGSFVIKGGGARTTITCARWRGFLVAANGTLDVTGLDTANADVGIESTKGAGAITITDSTITSTPRPFLVRAGSTVTANKVTATTPTSLEDFGTTVSVSEVFGTFNATYLSYEANTNEGVMVQNGGVASITDSTMTAKNGFDLISSYGGKSLTVSYTTMAGGHCGIHIAPAHDDPTVMPDTILVDHVTSQQNLFGITIYGATPTGSHVVKDSNFAGAADWLDLQGEHGPIDFEGNYTGGGDQKASILNTELPTFNTPAQGPIADAKPH